MLAKLAKHISDNYRRQYSPCCRKTSILNYETVIFILKCSICSSNIRSASSREDCKYDALGITPNATQKEIKDAYYKKSREFHPDLNQSSDASKQFQNVSDAYETLSNDTSRQEYDRSRGFRFRRPTSNGNDDDMNDDSDNNIHYNDVNFRFKKKMYSRMQRSNIETPGNDHFGQHPDARRDYIRVKSYNEFLQNLTPEMRKNYDDVISRMAEGKENSQDVEDLESGRNGMFIFLFLAIILIVTFNMFGEKLEKMDYKTGTLKDKTDKSHGSK